MSGVENKESILHPRYPQSNGLAEASNKILLAALKKRLDSYRTTAQRLIRISPFALTYGMEAIIPTEIGMPMLRTDVPEQLSTKSIVKDIDTVDKLRETATVRITSYHHRLENLYNRCVKPRVFQPGDLVLRKVFENTANLVGRTIYYNTSRQFRFIWTR